MQKNRVTVIQKEKKQPGLFSFWITMTRFFCTLLFATHILDLFLQGHKPTNIFKTRIMGADWLGECLKMTMLQQKLFEPIMTRFSNNRQGSNPILAQLPFCLLTHAYIRVRKKVSMKPNPTKHIGAYLVHIQWRCLFSSSGAWCTHRKLGIN